MKTIKITITKTACNSLKEINKSYTFNKITEYFETKEDAKKYLQERYGKKDFSKCRKVYSGSDVEIGFVHSFWNKDYSHNSKSWYQTDWVCIVEQIETPILLD